MAVGCFLIFWMFFNFTWREELLTAKLSNDSNVESFSMQVGKT